MADLLTLDVQNPADDVLETLDKARSIAEGGAVSAAIVVLVYRDGAVGHRSSSLPNIAMMIGALSRAMHKLNLWADDQASIPPEPDSAA